VTALADLSAVVNRVTGGNSGAPEHIWGWFDNRIGANAAQAPVAGRWSSLWQYNQFPNGAGATPGAAANPVRTDAGSFMQTNPGAGKQKWLLGLEAATQAIGTLMLYDRLAHQGNSSGTSTSAQTVSASAVRYTGSASAGNQIWLEIYTAIGATLTTITASYTNQAGTSGRTTPAVQIGGTGLNEAQRMIPLPLASGDTGVQSVQSVTLAATTGTAGAFGVTIARPLLILPCGGQASGGVRDCLAGLPSMPEIITDANLTLAWFAGATSPIPQVFCGLHFVDN
jgi:hypothetical protein